MGTSHRFFLVDADETLRAVPARVIRTLYQEPHFPAYAGQTVRYLMASIENEKGKPVRLLRYEAGNIQIDETGRADWGKDIEAIRLAQTIDHASRLARASGNVVGIEGQLSKKKLEREHRWTPTDRHITDLTCAIWPEQAKQYGKKTVAKAENVGAPPPRITHAAKMAEAELKRLLPQLSMQLDLLSREDLKGLKHRAETELQVAVDREPPDAVFFWRAVAEIIEHRERIRKAESTKSGTWYAVAERFRQGALRYSGELEHVEHVKCKGRDSAVRKARELIRKYADRFDAGVHYEVNIYPELVWDPKLAGVG